MEISKENYKKIGVIIQHAIINVSKVRFTGIPGQDVIIEQLKEINGILNQSYFDTINNNKNKKVKAPAVKKVEDKEEVK